MNIGQVLAGELRLDVGQLQAKIASLPADIQHQPQELPLRPFPGLFCVFGSTLSCGPAVPVNDRLPGVAGRGTAVPVRHPADGQVCILQIVHNGLRVGLVQLRGNAVDLSLHAGLNALDSNCHSALRQFLILAVLQLTVLEYIKGVDKILNTVKPVGFNHVDGIQNGDDWLKGPHAGIVVYILHNGDIGDGTALLLSDLAVLHLEIPFRGVNAEVWLALLVYLFQNTSDFFLPYATVVDAKRRSRVECVDGYRGTVLLTSFVREHHAYRYAANVHPVR